MYYMCAKRMVGEETRGCSLGPVWNRDFPMFFFLEHAGELRIIILRRKSGMNPYKHPQNSHEKFPHMFSRPSHWQPNPPTIAQMNPQLSSHPLMLPLTYWRLIKRVSMAMCHDKEKEAIEKWRSQVAAG